MTNNNLRADLISEIEGIERFVRDLPSAVREQHGFNDRPVTVRFGPDVETVFIDEDGENVLKPGGHQQFGVRTDAISQTKNMKDFLAGVEIDVDHFLEVQLYPGSALNICERYEALYEAMQDVADRHDGIEVHGISAHWHMSVVQGGHDKLFVGPVSSHSPSVFAEDVVNHMVEMQRDFPAFFVRPFRAEQHPLNSQRYAGPRKMDFDQTKGVGSINFSNISSPVRTIEPRISPDDPYQSAYLYLKALERTFEGAEVELDADVPSVRRGAGGYLIMLEETAQNLKERPNIFPPHVSDGMMRASIEGYQAYLDENPKAKPQDISDLKERLWTLQQEFSAPDAVVSRADLVVT